MSLRRENGDEEDEDEDEEDANYVRNRKTEIINKNEFGGE